MLYASTGTAAVGATALAFAEDFKNDLKNSYEAAERAGRVFATLAICINEYGSNGFFAHGTEVDLWAATARH